MNFLVAGPTLGKVVLYKNKLFFLQKYQYGV